MNTIKLFYSFTYLSNSELDTFRNFIRTMDATSFVVSSHETSAFMLRNIFFGRMLCIVCSSFSIARKVIDGVSTTYESMNLIVLKNGSLFISPNQMDSYINKININKKNSAYRYNYLYSFYATQQFMYHKKLFLINRYLSIKKKIFFVNNKYYY